MLPGQLFLANFEGFKAMPYQDGGGLWTIGYGTRIGNPDDYPHGISREDALTQMEAKIKALCMDLNTLNLGLVNQCQADALISFVYNIGFEAFKASDTYKLLQAKDTQCFYHWRQWMHDAKGNVEGGLVTRRLKEIKLFIFGIYT